MEEPADSIFSCPVTSVINTVRFDGDPFTCQCEKQKQKGLKGFKFRTFMGRFQVISWQ